MAIPVWFDKTAYFANKLAQTGSGWDALTLKAAFQEAGYAYTDEGMYQHYLDFGKSEGVSPNSWFDGNQYLYNKVAQDKGNANLSANEVKSMALAMENAGMSAWDHFDSYWAEYYATKGTFSNPSASFDVADYMSQKLSQAQQADPSGNWTMDKMVQSFVDAGLNPVEHYLMAGEAEGLIPHASTSTGATITVGQEAVWGTNASDYFSAAAGVLDDSTYIDGMGGNDTLYAAIKAGDDTIAPQISNVESVIFRAQATGNGLGNNNSTAHIDAGNISGMQVLGNDNSRASLSVEDVRINSTDLTIRFSNTDPGDVDFSVYFDPQHLTREESQTTGTLYAQLIDTVGALSSSKGGHDDPLYDNPYTGFKFSLNGKEYTLDFGAYNHETDATPSYAELVAQMQKAIDDNPELAGLGLTVELGEAFQAVVGIGSYKGEIVSGTNIVISSTQGALEGGNWIASNGLPPTNSTSATFDDASTTTCPLIQTNVQLDNVGRVQWDDASPCLPDDSIFGSEAGDLVIGSMAGRGGVERFDVTVDKGSWLSSISSTNNTLRMIKVTNGAVDGVNDNGNLFIGDAVQGGAGTDYELANWMNVPRLLSTDGLTDVKLFDASEMNGKVNIGAQLTANALDKYMADVDGVNTMYEGYAPNGAFQYMLGKNDDTLNMSVNAGIAADRDFQLDIKAGTGNDLVSFTFDNLTGSRLLNQIALNNVSIDLGAGNDELWFWGNGAVKVNDGAGNDKVYVGQNVDQNAVFVLGANSDAHTFIKAGPDGAQPLENEVVSTNTVGLHFSTLTAGTVTVKVTFNGISSEVTINVAANQTSISANDVNAAIIAAINGDPTLSALLVAKDGMGNSLLVESLIDGEFTAGDLAVDFTGTGVTIDAGGMYSAGSNSSELATDGVEALDQMLQVTTEGLVGTREVQILTADVDFVGGNATDNYTLVYNGVAHTVVRGADATAMATNLQTAVATAHTGATVTAVTNADGTTSFTITGATAGEVISNDTLLVKGEPAEVDGSDLGTSSMNTVDLTEGNDVIALNVGSGHNAFDTLVLNGAFGNDTVMGFQTGIDKFDATGMDFAGKLVDTTKTIDTTDARYGIDGLTVTAGNSLVFVQNADANADAGEYWVFSVTSSDATIGAGDTVTLLGTIATGTDATFAVGDIAI